MIRWFLTLACLLALEMSAGAQNTGDSSSSQALARSLSKSFADVYERVSPGVVVIEAEADDSADNLPQGSPLAQFFGRNPNLAPRQQQDTNQGSGFIITADGYILTNNHVLEGASADSVKVTLMDGRKLPAKIVGVDSFSDLAVIKIEGSNLPLIELGDSDRTRVGEFAFAIGAPYDLRDTFTYGIVSGKGRTNITGSRNYEEYLQTDASINPGNSGGPLVDIDGKVIGVNTLIRDFNRGLGFAIPINIAKKVASQLIADGRAMRPWLGIAIMSLDELPELTAQYPDLPKGILVRGIENGTPAALSDLRRNDIITKVDGTPVATARELQKAILDKKIGQEVELQVWRNSRLVKVKIRTAEHTEGFLPVANQRLVPPGAQRQSPVAPDDDETVEPSAPNVAPPAQAAPVPRSPGGGLMVRTLTADAAVAMNLQAEEGVLVTSVQPGSPAAAAGVQVGDVITSIGSTPVRTKEDFFKAIGAAAEDNLMLNINRGTEKTYEILKF